MNQEEARERHRIANRKWKRKVQAFKKKTERYGKNRCPLCSIKLDDEFRYYHQSCPWYVEHYLHPNLA